ncbi:N-acetyl-beta-D-galactosaminidase [Aureococcus anophagefferens]|nr:N-acetyl-beta-D-galactosaminidase [Aureococcus anophagefferens]
MAQKKYSPFAKKLQVHPVDDDGAAPEAATKTLEPATIREDYAQDVQYYKDLLAHQETGLLCCRSSLIINPKGRYMHCWDMVALVALLLTAVATPFETFFIPFRDPKHGGRLCKNHRRIFWNYVRGFFILDFLAAIPYDLIVMTTGGGILKMLRLIRLIRVARLGRIKAIFQRYMQRVTVNYAVLALCQFAFFLLLSVHWIACIWGMVASHEAVGVDTKPVFSWLDALERNKPSSCITTGRSRTATSPALYFAVYTLTGTGYGDIIPVNETEYAVCIVCMMYSALLWAFMIGKFCTIVAGMDKHGAQFRQTMDDVNYARDRQLPPEMCRRVRTYFVKKRSIMRARNHRRELSVCLEPILYAPLEPIDSPNALYALTSGVAIRKSKVLTHGEIWGLDFLLPSKKTHKWRGSKRRVVSVAITYVEVLMLSQSALNAILLDFPEELRRIRGASRWQVVRMALELWAMNYADEREERRREEKRRGEAKGDAPLAPLRGAAVADAEGFSKSALAEIRSAGLVHSSLARADDDDVSDVSDLNSPMVRAAPSPVGPGGDPPPGPGKQTVDAALVDQIGDLEQVIAAQAGQLAALRRAVSTARAATGRVELGAQ